MGASSTPSEPAPSEPTGLSASRVLRQLYWTRTRLLPICARRFEIRAHILYVPSRIPWFWRARDLLFALAGSRTARTSTEPSVRPSRVIFPRFSTRLVPLAQLLAPTYPTHS